MRSVVLMLALASAACPTRTGPDVAGPGATKPPTVAPGPSVFPIAEGASWTYTGTVKWYDKRADREREVKVEWLMECAEVIARGDAVGYVLHGHPADLVWSEGEAQRGTWLMVRRGNRWYLDRASPEQVEAFRANPTVDDDRLFMELPLTDGQRLCKDPETPSYCWDVSADGAAFDLTYRTNPDTTVVEITPGKGITAYDYVHHGTTAEVHVKLVTP